MWIVSTLKPIKRITIPSQVGRAWGGPGRSSMEVPLKLRTGGELGGREWRWERKWVFAKRTMYSEVVRRLAGRANEMDSLVGAGWYLKGWVRQVHHTWPWGAGKESWVFPKSNEEPLEDSWAEEWNFIMQVPFMPSWKQWFCSVCFQNGFHFLLSPWAPETFVWSLPRIVRYFAAAPPIIINPQGHPG